MEQTRAVEVIQSLAAGIDPFTGEVFNAGSTLQNPEVVRALFVAVSAMQGAKAGRPRAAVAPAAGKAWSEVEDRELASEFDAGTSEQEIATRHQRTVGAIRSRLVKLGRLDPAAYQGRIRQ
jgi:hypothetical protein